MSRCGCSVQAQFYVKTGGQLPQILALPPNILVTDLRQLSRCGLTNLNFDISCDMKHCSANSKHQQLGAKRSALWPSKYVKMRLERGHPFPYPIPLGASARLSGLRRSVPSPPQFEGALPPNISSETAPRIVP